MIPLNIQEIFTWYFEQKGVENPERFLGVNENGVNEVNNPEEAQKAGVEVENNIQANEEIPQVVDKNTTPIEQPVQNQQQANEPTLETDSFNKFIGQLDENTLQIVLQILTNYIAQKGDNTKANDFIDLLKEVIEEN